MTLDTAHWSERLAVLADKHGVPGATFAVLQGDEIAEAAYGVLNLRTGAPVATDALFQIGSITKVWTATLVMQLVDEGLIDLDLPIVTYLPDFKVADPEVTRTVTARNLLCHNSGIDGDLFLDTGRGDDAVEKYVAACATLGQNHPLGATMSYCNSGYTVLGRLVEVVRGQSWDAVLKERLFVPLGLDSAGTLPEEALLHAAACGHVTPPGGEIMTAPMWGIFRSAGPAGLIHATAAQTLAFAKLHLNDGVAPDGTRVLSSLSIAAMRVPQVEVPDPYTLGSHWGLGWILMRWSDREVFGHDGGTIGQSAFLRVVPDAGVALSLLTNGGHGRDLYEDLFREALAELCQIDLPARLEPPSEPVSLDLAPYIGRYKREGIEIAISERAEGGLTASVHNVSGLAAELGAEPTEIRLVPLKADLFVGQAPGDEAWTPAVFFELSNGQRYLHFGARATPKIS
jgi:CubicO group peptidase (beta-lactamase class C family)